VDVKVRKVHNLLWACGETWGLTLKAVHWLCFYHSAVHHFCILRMVAGCQMAGAKKTLSRIQRLVCLGKMGASCTTTTGAKRHLLASLH
jgi:hypothetical protein